VTVKVAWESIQSDIAVCTRCKFDLPQIKVNCPPNLIFPDRISPPRHVKVLFVGVAPPEKGRHFYTDRSDKLLLGVFRTLGNLDRPCGGLEDFIDRGYFLVHACKCAIQGTTKPSKKAALLCSSIHLKAEVESLLPNAICFLSKKIGVPVMEALIGSWGGPRQVEAGETVKVSVRGKSIVCMATLYPARGHEKITRKHLNELFQQIGL
jgi:hypothetical protein